jgi:hypothetical protein
LGRYGLSVIRTTHLHNTFMALLLLPPLCTIRLFPESFSLAHGLPNTDGYYILLLQMMTCSQAGDLLLLVSLANCTRCPAFSFVSGV